MKELLERTLQEDGIEVDSDGRTRVKRYLEGQNGPKLDTLFETAHGVVKMTFPQLDSNNGKRRMDKESVYMKFKFPKKLGLELTKALFHDECDEIMSFLKTRKQETIWE